MGLGVREVKCEGRIALVFDSCSHVYGKIVCVRVDVRDAEKVA